MNLEPTPLPAAVAALEDTTLVDLDAPADDLAEALALTARAAAIVVQLAATIAPCDHLAAVAAEHARAAERAGLTACTHLAAAAQAARPARMSA